MLGYGHGSWLGNCKEGNSTKSLSSCRWKPSQAERLGSVQPGFCQVPGCLKSFLGQRIYHGGRGNLGWAEEGRKCKQCFLGLSDQVLPSRATEGALLGLRKAGRVAAAVVQAWPREICSAAPGSLPVLRNSACAVCSSPPFAWRCQALTLSQAALCLLSRGESCLSSVPCPLHPNISSLLARGKAGTGDGLSSKLSVLFQ